MNYQELKPRLKDQGHADQYLAYLEQLATEKSWKGQLKNPWMGQMKTGYLALIYNTVADTGLVFDGINITLISTGVSYNYQAYKNKMLLAYPETILDLDLVYEGDDFAFSKTSGSVVYHHKINDVFDRDDAKIIGGYCIIKNKRGEFLTTLTRAEIDKHRAVAKTDKIWAGWFVEMAKKTLIKKASRLHFDDVYNKINAIDNENVDLDLPLDIDIQVKGQVEAITTLSELEEYFHANRAAQEDQDLFNGIVARRKKEIEETV